MYAKKTIFTVPNLLTLLRLLLLPFVMALIGNDMHEYKIEIFALLFFQGITDVLDGFIARKYHCISELGKILDPIVDKILICGIMIVLLQYGFPSLLFWIAVSRDICILAVGYFFIIRKRNFIPVSNISGKIATFFLVTFCLLFIAGYQLEWYYMLTLGVLGVSAISYTIFTVKLYVRGRQ